MIKNGKSQGPNSSKQDNHMSSRTGSNSAGDFHSEPQVLSIFSSHPMRTFSSYQAKSLEKISSKNKITLGLQVLSLHFYKCWGEQSFLTSKL